MLKLFKKGIFLIFGSISYINLLPFQIFIKKEINNIQFKQILNYKKSTPSAINKAFKQKRVDAAFISSIKSKNCKCTDLGIVANGAVYSVFVDLSKEPKLDSESDTSNILAKLLKLNGQVIIGDKALKYYLKHSSNNLVDLSLKWKQKRKLPFVFARLCYNKNGKKIQKLAKKFQKSQPKIPYYYLKRVAKQKGLSINELKWYLNHISYNLGYKEKKSLKLFLKEARNA